MCVCFNAVCTQASWARNRYSQKDVCQNRKTILQTHQEEAVGADIDMNIKYHQQSAVMFLQSREEI